MANGESLGHRTSVDHIEELLGAHVLSQRCELIVPREMQRAKRARMKADCDFRVRQMEHWFGLRQPGRVRVFVFFRPNQRSHHSQFTGPRGCTVVRRSTGRAQPDCGSNHGYFDCCRNC